MDAARSSLTAKLQSGVATTVGRLSLQLFAPTPPLAAMALWARQCALLLRAGLTLAEVIDTLREQPGSPVMQALMAQVHRSVLCGAQLSEALAQHPQAFPRHICGAVRAGEQSGALPDALSRLADLFESDLDLRRQLNHAAFYPVVAFTLTAALCLVVTLLVVPQFQVFYSDFSGGEAQLPLLTRYILSGTEWLLGHWPWLVLLAPAALGLRWLRNTHPVKTWLDPRLLRVPLFGLLARKADCVRCCRALAVLFASGVPLDEALELAADCTVNYSIRESLRRVMIRAARGMPLAEALRFEPTLAPLLASAVAVALDAAGAAENLTRVADMYETDIRRSLHVLLRQLEPALVALVGLWTGLIAVSLYLPIFNLVDVIK